MGETRLLRFHYMFLLMNVIEEKKKELEKR